MQGLRNAGCLACCAHYVGSQRSQLTLWGVLEGGIIHKKDLESPPGKGGELIAVSCQSALIRCINLGFASYTLEPCDYVNKRSGMGLCCYGESRG